MPNGHSNTPEAAEVERQRRLNETCQRYRNVFGTEEGRLVLGDILTCNHFGVTLDPDNPVQVAEYNVALTILFKTGFLEVLSLELRTGR
jgi:hypothetical protein